MHRETEFALLSIDLKAVVYYWVCTLVCNDKKEIDCFKNFLCYTVNSVFEVEELWDIR